jgi:hypothetical protein
MGGLQTSEQLGQGKDRVLRDMDTEQSRNCSGRENRTIFKEIDKYSEPSV